MASNTTYYNLKKPAGTDYYNVADFNGNADKLDAALHTHDGNISTINSNISTINGNITSINTTVNGHTSSISTINTKLNTLSPTTMNKTLSAGSWSGSTYTLTGLTGVTANSCGDLYSAPTATATQDKAFTRAQLKVTAQGSGSITIVARGTVPTINLPITIEVRNPI